MLLFVTVLHLIVAVLLIVMVLIQDSKGSGAFGMGGSGSNQVFSATGAANFLVTVTRTLAIIFAITCISLTYLTTRKSSSVVDDYVAPASAPAAGATAPTSATPTTAATPNAAEQKHAEAPATENKAPQNTKTK